MKVVKKLLHCLLVTAMMLSMLSIFSVSASAAVSWPSVSSSSYIEFTATKTIYCWKNTGCTTRGTCSPSSSYNAYISSGDVCKVIAVNSSYAKVIYPTSSGNKTAYCKTKDIFGATAPSLKFTSKGTATTYVKASTSTKYGSVYKNDTVWVCSTSGNYTYVIYSAKSGSRAYKLGYVSTSVLNKTLYPVTAVKLSSTSFMLKGVGSTKTLTATLTPSGSPDTVTWTSSDTSVAKVSSSGKVTSVGLGTATITATSTSGKKATAKVLVSIVPSTSVKLSSTSFSLTVGSTKTLTATLSPSNSTDSVTWKSSDKTIATVSSSGKVTAVKAGTAKITATTASGKTASATVTVTASNYSAKVAAFLSESRYKNGATWSSSQRPLLSSWSATGCCAYTCDFAKYVFGKNSHRDGTTFTSVSSIKAGDILHIDGKGYSTHWIAVISRDGNKLQTAEGNWGGKVVVSSSAYTISGNTLKRGSRTYTLTLGYHMQ